MGVVYIRDPNVTCHFGIGGLAFPRINISWWVAKNRKKCRICKSKLEDYMSNNQLTNIERQELLTLRAEKEKKDRTEAPYAKISPKGAIMVGKIGRFPTTLYPNQWRKVFSLKSEIEALYDASEKACEK